MTIIEDWGGNKSQDISKTGLGVPEILEKILERNFRVEANPDRSQQVRY